MRQAYSLRDAEPFIPFEILGHATVSGEVTTTTEEIVESLLQNGAPERLVSLDRLLQGVGRSALPRVKAGETAETLGFKAIQKVFEEFDIDPKRIDFVATATSTPPMMVPEPSKYQHEKLGMSSYCRTLTIGNACQGGVDALDITASMISRFPGSGIGMVVAVDVLSPQLGAADPRTQAIFSDVAVCYVIQYNPEARSGVILSGPVTGSEYRDGLQLGHNDTDKIKMKGEKVRKSILGLVPLAVERARKYGNNDLIQINQTRSEEDSVLVDLDELAVIASHLPSDVMFAEIATILEHNGYSRDRMPNNFALLGNSSAATTLANLDKIIRDGLLPAGELYGLLSAAVGATAILNVLRYNES